MSGQQTPQYPSYRRQGYSQQPGPSVPSQSYSSQATPAPSRSNTSSSTSARTPRNWAQAFVPVYRMTATIIHGWLAKRFPTEFEQYDLKAFAVEPFNDVFRFRVPKALSQEEVDSIIDLREKDEED